MHISIGGRAIPSLSPLSTLIVCLILSGTSLLVTTACPSAASVGDNISAIRMIAQIPMSGNIGLAISAPEIIVMGKPINNNLNGRLLSLINFLRFIVEASINKTRIRVSSASILTSGPFTLTCTSSATKRLVIMPTATNTIGAVTIEFSASLEKIPYPSIRTAIKMKIGYSLIWDMFSKSNIVNILLLRFYRYYLLNFRNSLLNLIIILFMKRLNYGSTALWNTILLFAVIFAVFVLPVLSEGWHRSLFRSVYTLIYFSAILSLEKRKNSLIILLVSTFVTEWISGILNLSVLLILAKFVNILFFLVIVVSLIRQIATARKVSCRSYSGFTDRLPASRTYLFNIYYLHNAK